MAQPTIKPEDLIVASGTWGTVEYAVCDDGTSPSKEFYESLRTEDRAKFAPLFQLMANTGFIRGKSKFRKERGHIFAFKKNAADGRMIRFPCFRHEKRWILTHGFYKPAQNEWPEVHFTTAERVMSEHLGRISKANPVAKKTSKGRKRR
jgi:hypothetical protein